MTTYLGQKLILLKKTRINLVALTVRTAAANSIYLLQVIFLDLEYKAAKPEALNKI